jgi:AmmeMemoRadiSam system protein B
VGGKTAYAEGMRVRPAAVAGQFYPRDQSALRLMVEELLAAAGRGVSAASSGRPRAVIVPHAGFVYSGPIAASAYARLMAWKTEFRHVLLIGPAHRVPVDGLALSSADAFETPLGPLPVDRDACVEALQLGGVQEHDLAHRDEHSLEVQLPFVQVALPDASILPVLAGRGATPAMTAALLDTFLDRPGWVVVISSDLSHFHAAEECHRLDEATSQAIERLADDELNGRRACGHIGIRGLLQAARRRQWHVTTVDLRHSGDTGGPRDSVVGYGAYVVC